jgi:phosphate transport system permease protein
VAASAPGAGPAEGAGDSPLSGLPGDGTRGGRGGLDVIRWLGRAGAIIPLGALIFIVIVLLVEAIPAFRYNGLSFFSKSVYTPGGGGYNSVIVHTGGAAHQSGASFGFFSSIIGTLITTLIAVLVGVPLSIGAALAIVERLPKRLAAGVGVFLELLAGIPSVVIGLWGVVTFGPFLARDIVPFVSRNLPDVPVLNYFKGPINGLGQSMLASGLILAIMIIPIVASTARDLIRQVPILPREGAVALGMSDAQCAMRVTLPWIRTGLIGAIVLGIGRALGETIAVAMVSGNNTAALPSDIYGTMTTIAATLVNSLDSAFQDGSGFSVRALAELALVLVIITLAVNIAARMLVRRTSGAALPIGPGL